MKCIIFTDLERGEQADAKKSHKHRPKIKIDYMNHVNLIV